MASAAAEDQAVGEEEVADQGMTMQEHLDVAADIQRQADAVLGDVDESECTCVPDLSLHLAPQHLYLPLPLPLTHPVPTWLAD